MRAPEEKLLDILEAVARIERYTSEGRSRFDQDELIQTWVIYHLQTIGEAAARLKADFKQEHPEIPWSRYVAMRNILVHEYFGIDRDKVWRVVERDLPPLKASMRKLLGDKGPR